ncbi:thioredoxin family protein [Pontibacter sp. E15-1]|uniref:TlpA family protein disulfide reductase n=1 Tax=Pontibacter sp. E15-1 TaxID=2919918 RepID=UPI001F4F7507|nr:redoxin domain-containing protein [Pontibacter sp. E15-1]MCJ8164068.1 thioredoxin family protein [Pontibacter sp. E15-1]
MKKLLIITVLSLIALAAFIYFGAFNDSPSNNQPVEAMQAPAQAASNDLPAMPLSLMDGSRVMTKNLQGKTILVLYQPDCDHCQREATQIQENLQAFEGYTLYFISDADFALQQQFADTYKLAGQENVYFATATVNDILDQIGPIQTPSLFVYSAEGRLVKSFIGETPIEQILQVL